MDADDVEDLREHWPGVVAAYENAVEDAEHARSVWVKAGRPLEQQHKNGTSGLHPLMMATRLADQAVAARRTELGLSPKAGKMVVRRGVGRPIGSPERPEPPRIEPRDSREEKAAKLARWRAQVAEHRTAQEARWQRALGKDDASYPSAPRSR